MKITKKQLKDFVISEIKNLDGETTKDMVFENSENIDNSESENVDIEEVKVLAEEIKRMKALVDFRSPLLKKD